MVYLVCSGESEANREGIWGGNTPLTEAGKRQAKELAPVLIKEITKSLQSGGLEMVVSPQTSAIQTADYAFGNILDVQKFHIDEAFREIHFGRYEECRIKPGQCLSYFEKNASSLHRITGGDNLQERADEAILRLLDYQKGGKDVYIFTHNTLIRSILCRLYGKSMDQIAEYKAVSGNGSIVGVNTTCCCKAIGHTN